MRTEMETLMLKEVEEQRATSKVGPLEALRRYWRGEDVPTAELAKALVATGLPVECLERGRRAIDSLEKAKALLAGYKPQQELAEQQRRATIHVRDLDAALTEARQQLISANSEVLCRSALEGEISKAPTQNPLVFDTIEAACKALHDATRVDGRGVVWEQLFDRPERLR